MTQQDPHLDRAIGRNETSQRQVVFPLVGERRYLFHSVVAPKLGLVSNTVVVLALVGERRYLLHLVTASKFDLASHIMMVMVLASAIWRTLES